MLIGAVGGRSRPDEVIVVNPFGLAIEDVVLAARVYDEARSQGVGLLLER